MNTTLQQNNQNVYIMLEKANCVSLTKTGLLKCIKTCCMNLFITSKIYLVCKCKRLRTNEL